MAFLPPLTTSAIDYPTLLRDALLGVLRRVLERLADIGPTGEVHLLLTFRTDLEGTKIPVDLRRRFPDRMTIELQHQFWELATDDEAFSVLLAFGGKRTHLRVPWEAVVGFVDPEESFGLSFEAPEEPSVDGPQGAPEQGAEVIPFDRFRRDENRGPRP